MTPSSSNVLVIGEVLYDRISESPKPGAPTKLWLGGAPANMAAGLAQYLPNRVFLLAGCGTDTLGEKAKISIGSFGVQTQFCIDSDDPTRVFLLQLHEGGEKTFLGFEQPSNAYADEAVDVESVQRTCKKTKPALIYHGSLVAAKKKFREALQTAHILANQNDSLCFMDINLREAFFPSTEEMLTRAKELLKNVDILKISDDEIVQLYPEHANTKDFRGALTKLAEDYPDISLILLTAGPMGSIALYKNAIVGEFKKSSVKAVDATGAGDAYCAGAIAEIMKQREQGKTLENLHVESILEHAQQNAHKAIQHFGAVSYIKK